MTYTVTHGSAVADTEFVGFGVYTLAPKGSLTLDTLSTDALAAQARNIITIVPDAPEATTDEINRIADISERVVSIAEGVYSYTNATLLTYDGKILVSALTGVSQVVDITLPPATGSGVKLRLVTGAPFAGSGFAVNCIGTGSYLVGVVYAADESDTVNFDETWVTILSDTTETMFYNGTTSGGANYGDDIILIDIMPGVWAVRGTSVCIGAEVTPFGLAPA